MTSDIGSLRNALPFWLSLGTLPMAMIAATWGGWTILLMPAYTWGLYALLDAILGSLPGVYYMYDENRHFVRWNAKFELVTGYTGEEIASLHPLDLFEGESRAQVAAAIEGVFRTGFGQPADFRPDMGRADV